MLKTGKLGEGNTDVHGIMLFFLFSVGLNLFKYTFKEKQNYNARKSRHNKKLIRKRNRGLCTQ